MGRDRIWGRRIWAWWAHGAVAVLCLVLATVSHTVSGTTLPIMVIVAQVFLTVYAYAKSREAKRIRDEWGIDEDGVWSRA